MPLSWPCSKTTGNHQVEFRQEIYDDKGQLVEVHEKYPLDRGHRKVEKEKGKGVIRDD